MASIEWVGEVLAKQGYGVLTREFLRPIVDHVKLIPKEDYVKPEDKYDVGLWAEKAITSMSMPEGDIRINFCIPPMFESIQGKMNIGMCLWELDTYPKEWLPSMAKMDGLIFPAKDMAHTARQCGLKNLIGFFKPYIDITRWKTNVPPTDISNATGVKYLIETDWNPLSNIEEALQAFCIAFEGNSDVTLIVKLNNTGNIEQKRGIRGAIGGMLGKLLGLSKPKIILLDDDIPEESSVGLIKAADYVISVNGAVALDMHALKIATIGKPIIGLETRNRDLSLISYKIKGAHHSMIYPAMYHRFTQFYLKPDIKELAMALFYSYNLIKNDKSKYTVMCENSQKAAETYLSTDLLQVCENMYTAWKANRENERNQIPQVAL